MFRDNHHFPGLTIDQVVSCVVIKVQGSFADCSSNVAVLLCIFEHLAALTLFINMVQWVIGCATGALLTNFILFTPNLISLMLIMCLSLHLLPASHIPIKMRFSTPFNTSLCFLNLEITVLFFNRRKILVILRANRPLKHPTRIILISKPFFHL